MFSYTKFVNKKKKEKTRFSSKKMSKTADVNYESDKFKHEIVHDINIKLLYYQIDLTQGP